jgi:hypothetical protein
MTYRAKNQDHGPFDQTFASFRSCDGTMIKMRVVANQKGRRLFPTGEESSPQTEATVQQRQPRLPVKKSDSRFRRLPRLQRQWTNDHLGCERREG